MPPASPSADQLIHLFRYTYWADGRVIDRLREIDPPEARDDLTEARRLLSHALRAQVVWWERMQDPTPSTDIWAVDDLDTCAERSATITQRWIEAVRTDDLTAPVEYQNSSGTTFTNQRREMAHHVVNHATHHRAQIARLLRQAGHEPPATDYIFFARDPETNPRLRTAVRPMADLDGAAANNRGNER